jgi:hypothetical protein
VYDVHTYRADHAWDKRRHIFNVDFEARPRLAFGIGSEPPGNGALVSTTANKHELDDESVPLLAVASLQGRQAFVWFSGEGVKLDRGLRHEAGFWTTPRAVARLPRDVMRYETPHHSGDSQRHIRILTADGESRVDCRTAHDGRFSCTLDGPTGTYRYRVERGFVGELCDAGTDTCEPVARTVGDELRVTFTRGRYLTGRVQ